LTKIKVMTIYYQKVKWRLYLHRRGINELGLTRGAQKPDFFYENTSFVLEDEVKNPVSLSKCVQECEYKFHHRPINCMGKARRCIQISGNG
jgi:hypothetical protein